MLYLVCFYCVRRVRCYFCLFVSILVLLKLLLKMLVLYLLYLLLFFLMVLYLLVLFSCICYLWCCSSWYYLGVMLKCVLSWSQWYHGVISIGCCVCANITLVLSWYRRCIIPCWINAWLTLILISCWCYLAPGAVFTKSQDCLRNSLWLQDRHRIYI